MLVVFDDYLYFYFANCPATTGIYTYFRTLSLHDSLPIYRVIPRCGEWLSRFVADNARVPVIQHYKGVCHLYVDASADPALALKLLIDGKTTRPAVCNALETLLVHQDIAASFIANAVVRLRALGVQVRGCARTQAISNGVVPASDSDFGTEFLDRILAVRVVDEIGRASCRERVCQYV